MKRRQLWKSEWALLAALLLLVSLHFWFPNLQSGPQHDTFSPTAQGKKAFYLLVRQQGNAAGVTVTRNRTPLSQLDAEFGFGSSGIPILCLLGPERYPTDGEWEKILDWVSSGGNLVFAAGFDKAEISIPQSELEVKKLKTPIDVEEDRIQTELVGGGNLLWKSRGEVVAASYNTRLIAAEDTVQAVLQNHGSGRIVVVASDYVFSNQSLAWEDNGNGELAFRLLEWAGADGDIYFDESLNESGTPKAVGILFGPPFRPLTVQLMIGMLVFGWWRKRRFGPQLPKAVPARHNIVDHTDSLGIINYKTKNGVIALRSYLRQLYFELKLKTYKGREDKVLEPIAVRAGTTTAKIRKLLRRASKAARGKSQHPRTTAEYIRRLAELRKACRRNLRSDGKSERQSDEEEEPS